MVFIINLTYAVFLVTDPYYVLCGRNFQDDCDFLPLQQSSVISSTTNLGLYGQGLLQLTGDGDAIKGQRLSLSLFYNVTVSNYRYKDSLIAFIRIRILSGYKRFM